MPTSHLLSHQIAAIVYSSRLTASFEGRKQAALCGYRWLGPASVGQANSMHFMGFLMYALEETCTLFMDVCALPN